MSRFATIEAIEPFDLCRHAAVGKAVAPQTAHSACMAVVGRAARGRSVGRSDVEALVPRGSLGSIFDGTGCNLERTRLRQTPVPQFGSSHRCLAEV